jgi:hypothetical protein
MFDIYGNTRKISCCEPLRDSRKESLSMDEGRILKQTARDCNNHVPKRSDVVREKSRSSGALKLISVNLRIWLHTSERLHRSARHSALAST